MTVDHVARFVSWLRAPAPNVIVLDGGTARRTAATVNRHLAAIFGFYEHHARSGVKVAAGLVAWRRIGRGSYKPFLHHVTGGRPIATRPVKLAVPQRAPRTLSAEQIVQVLAAPVRARDRFLLALLAETGVRVGQAVGLRHCDFVSRAKEDHPGVPRRAPPARHHQPHAHRPGRRQRPVPPRCQPPTRPGQPRSDHPRPRSPRSQRGGLVSQADNTAHLWRAAADRHDAATRRTIAVIDEFDRNGTSATVAGVASAAGVARSWL